MKKSISWASLYGLVALVFLLTVYYGNRAVTVISQSMHVARKHIIVLDAGHSFADCRMELTRVVARWLSDRI